MRTPRLARTGATLTLLATAVACTHVPTTRSIRPTFEMVEPPVAWQEVAEVNLDGDEHPDFVALGTNPEHAAVGIVLGARPASVQVFRLRANSDAQDGLCGPSEDAVLGFETCTPDGEIRCVPASTATSPRLPLQRIVLSPGECDAFRFFFDGREITWFRH